jgi:hypothetical protein
MQERKTLSLRLLPARDPWEAMVLPLSRFPTPEEELAPVRQLLREFRRLLGKERETSSEVFLQLAALYLGDGAARFARHAPDWNPRTGLGVWPDRPPPTLWTIEELSKLLPGQMPRPAMYQVFHITVFPVAGPDARDVMLGLGTVLEVLKPRSDPDWMERTKGLLLPPIQDPSLTSFPFYVPLLEGKSIAGADSAQLDAWLCGACSYIRESSEDSGILILAREPLRPILAQLGGVLETGLEPRWRIPLPPKTPYPSTDALTGARGAVVYPTT